MYVLSYVKNILYELILCIICCVDGVQCSKRNLHVLYYALSAVCGAILQ